VAAASGGVSLLDLARTPSVFDKENTPSVLDKER
jgi:hypothetical protein